MKLPAACDEAHRAAEVRAAGGDRDELVRVLLQVAWSRGARRRVVLPASPIPGTSVKTTWLVGVGGEVVDRPDRLPALLAAVEDRRDREADGGQDDRGAGQAAERLRRRP